MSDFNWKKCGIDRNLLYSLKFRSVGDVTMFTFSRKKFGIYRMFYITNHTTNDS